MYFNEKKKKKEENLLFISRKRKIENYGIGTYL